MLMRMWISAAHCTFASLAALALLIGPTTVFAQTVYDPTIAEFRPSPEHSATSSDGTPVLSHYLLEIFPVGSSQAAFSISLGKPSPESDGLIRVSFVPLLGKPLVAGTNYNARVSAVGPGGKSASQASNVFAASGPCAPSLSTRTLSVPSAASTGSVNISTGATCAWSAAANASWLTITSAKTGTGPASLAFTVAVNGSQSSRTGTLTIAGITFTVTQGAAAPTCSYTLSRDSKTVATAGETTTVGVTAGSGCAWTATSGASWMTVTSGSSGTGNGTTTIKVAANSGATDRTGTVTIGGRPFTVTQAGTCSFTVTPSSVSVAAAASKSTFSISTKTGCTWTATGMPSWITMASTGTTGSGTLSFTIAANIAPARSATLTIAGKSVVVKQGAPVIAAPGNFRIVTQRGGSDR